ncbi:hypothetical protein N8I77_009595 [Diaporthe amygdali]|uniref:Uncharacterized protein n=1 Tax=Phomopsis amygdali TaxID=1214568 RepID=A0AAD9SBM3_PHOAM|nr:hypothetical protein N8I77_009595 [Diaporthe amygdali]
MVGPGEKGLASSRWAPINTGRPPYYWTSNRFKQSAPSLSSSSTATTIHTTTSAEPRIPAPSIDTVPTTTPNPSNGFTYTGNPYEADASALNRIPTPWSELSRFMKIARRMRWKLPFLGQGYRAATDRALNTDDDRAEAELHFKLDFFEYYMLLERALVHLMGVFGVRVTGALGGARTGSRTANGAGPQQQGPQSDHRFHANVLDALDDPRNPLHGVLGSGDARYALARAKELRNRWKNADEPDAVVAARLANGSHAAVARPLEDYDLERILENIFDGLEGAYVIADRYVAGVRALAAERGLAASLASAVSADTGAEEAQWEFMVDAMDWELV